MAAQAFRVFRTFDHKVIAQVATFLQTVAARLGMTAITLRDVVQSFKIIAVKFINTDFVNENNSRELDSAGFSNITIEPDGAECKCNSWHRIVRCLVIPTSYIPMITWHKDCWSTFFSSRKWTTQTQQGLIMSYTCLMLVF